MRSLLLLIAILLLAGCGAKNYTAKSQNPSEPTRPPEAAQAEKPAEATKAAIDANGPPVNFTFLGITPDKASVSYKIRVNTDKPIDEVHLALKETDGKGKVVEDTTIIWQNIVGLTRRPIEAGKTYEDQTTLDPAAVKAECSLKEVIFKDGTRWNAR